MYSYFAGFITSTVLFIIGIVLYAIKVKPLRQQLAEERAKRKVAEVTSEILNKKLPGNPAGRLERFRQLAKSGRD